MAGLAQRSAHVAGEADSGETAGQDAGGGVCLGPAWRDAGPRLQHSGALCGAIACCSLECGRAFPSNAAAAPHGPMGLCGVGGPVRVGPTGRS
jgi:hypothetical protein